jgi:hypothetical protein
MNPTLIAVGMLNLNPATFALKNFEGNSFVNRKYDFKTRIRA